MSWTVCLGISSWILLSLQLQLQWCIVVNFFNIDFLPALLVWRQVFQLYELDTVVVVLSRLIISACVTFRFVWFYLRAKTHMYGTCLHSLRCLNNFHAKFFCWTTYYPAKYSMTSTCSTATNWAFLIYQAAVIWFYSEGSWQSLGLFSVNMKPVLIAR